GSRSRRRLRSAASASLRISRPPPCSSLPRTPPGSRARRLSSPGAIGDWQIFLFKPNEAHQLVNDGTHDLVVYVVADNPLGESVYYPDSKKWGVRAPERRVFRGEA